MSESSCVTLSCEIEELKNGLNVIFLSKLVSIASYTILIYDYFLTFGREKELIWHCAKFNVGKILFLSIRYFTLFVMTFAIAGLAWVRFHWIAGLITVMLAELTLQVRLYAMYGKTRTILLFMIFTFLTTFGIILMFIARLFTKEDATFFHPFPDNELFICIPSNVPGFYIDVWVPLFVHEFILLALAVNKGVQSVWTHHKSGYVSRLIVFLVKDSVLYYFSVFSVSLSLELVWAIGGVNYIELPYGLVVVIVSTMCQRMLLQIKSHFNRRAETITTPSWPASSQGSGGVVHVKGLGSEYNVYEENIMPSTFRSR